MALAGEQRLEEVRLPRLDHAGHAHAQDHHKGDVRHLARPGNAYPRARWTQPERVAVLHERDVVRFAHGLRRRLHPFAIDVLGVERQPTAPDDTEAPGLHVLLKRLVVLRLTERAHHLAGPEQEDVLVEAGAALARTHVEPPVDVEVDGLESRRHGGTDDDWAE